MDANVLTIIVSVVALIIAAVAIFQARRAGTPISGELLTATLQESTFKAQQLTDVALTAAQAAEQLYRTGKIAKGERLDRAFAYVKKWFPDLDQATIVTAIEAGVLVVNSIVDASANYAKSPTRSAANSSLPTTTYPPRTQP